MGIVHGGQTGRYVDCLIISRCLSNRAFLEALRVFFLQLFGLFWFVLLTSTMDVVNFVVSLFLKERRRLMLGCV